MRSPLIPARRLDPEWMDRADNLPAALTLALEDIRSVNRLLGGSKIVVEALQPFFAEGSGEEPLSILDVGTGAADIPVAVVDAARALGRRVRVVAVDRDPVTVAHARRAVAGVQEIAVARAEAGRLPFPAASFDVVIASMFLHHFGHREAVGLLEGFRRLARRAVLVNDLRRHLVPWAFIGLAARASARSPMFVHDAPLSVLRGFTEDELLAMGREAGDTGAAVSRRFPYRLLLTLAGGSVRA